MKSRFTASPFCKTCFSRYRAALLIATALASAWPAVVRAQFIPVPNQIVLTSPEIQSGAGVALLAFSGNAARRGEPDFDGAKACGLNEIVKPIDASTPQFVSALFNKTQIPTASIASSMQGTIFYQVDLTGITVDKITRSDAAAVNQTATPGSGLTETVTLRATAVTYTYQPINGLGQKNGPPVIFSWNCVTNQPL
jgi:type VI protein secretion system component Hcp